MGPVFSGDNLAFPGTLGRGYRGGRAVEGLVDVTSERLNQDSHRAARALALGWAWEPQGPSPVPMTAAPPLQRPSGSNQG